MWPGGHCKVPLPAITVGYDNVRTREKVWIQSLLQDCCFLGNKQLKYFIFIFQLTFEKILFVIILKNQF